MVDRLADYHFESLAYGFANRKADPFLVTINPGQIPVIHPTTHPGQEFNYVIEGSVRVQIGNSSVVLNEGDSIYFDSSLPHGQEGHLLRERRGRQRDGRGQCARRRAEGLCRQAGLRDGGDLRTD